MEIDSQDYLMYCSVMTDNTPTAHIIRSFMNDVACSNIIEMIQWNGSYGRWFPERRQYDDVVTSPAIRSFSTNGYPSFRTRFIYDDENIILIDWNALWIQEFYDGYLLCNDNREKDHQFYFIRLTKNV